MEVSTLKKLQKVELEILEVVHNICEENKLTYYLIAGSLLGAVRHKGFIPWDDDIDIAMPRKDYRKFIKLCHEGGVLGKKYMLQDISTDPKRHLSYAKIRKNNTLFDEYALRNLNCHKGIFIDIFPLDQSKKNKGIWYHGKSWFVQSFINVILMRVMGPQKVSWLHKVLYGLTRPLSIRTIWSIREKIAASCKNGNYYIDYGSWYGYVRETMPIDWYGEPVLVDFEDKKFYAPQKSDLILTQIYGDYMKLPPQSERRNHNPTRVIFDVEKEKNKAIEE